MFENCTNLNSVTCLATNISASYCTYYWLDGVAATGTFTKAASTDWSGKTGASGIPSGWTAIPVIPGEFSVSSTKKVFFSQGNLQATYSGSAWTWAFAEHQWDYIGNAAGNTKVTASSPFVSENATVDLFGWVGESSSWDDVNKYGITSSDSSALEKADGYGNGSSDELKSDWGKLAITNGGNTANFGWRTLSHTEWLYLFNYRIVNGGTGAGKSYTLGQSVSGKLGVVLYPDNYTGSEYTTGSDWASFEAAGCVFLPAAGYRDVTSVSNVGSNGYYWSESYNGRSYAFCVLFNSNHLDVTNSSMARCYGSSVRLVRDAN